MATINVPGFTNEDFERSQRVFSNVVAKYYGDPEFKTRVDADPAEALRAEGIPIPAGVAVTVVANTADVAYFVLPPDPNVELSDEALSAVAGGDTASTAGSMSSLLCVFTTFSSVGSAGTASTMAVTATTPP